MKKIFLLAVFAIGMSATAQKLPMDLTSALKNDDTSAIATLVTAANKDNCYDFASGNLNVLQLAASMRSTDVIIHLLTVTKVDANATCSGKTPLMLAASQGNSAAVQELLTAGAKRGTKVDGKTALDFAKESKNDATIALLK